MNAEERGASGSGNEERETPPESALAPRKPILADVALQAQQDTLREFAAPREERLGRAWMWVLIALGFAAGALLERLVCGGSAAP